MRLKTPTAATQGPTLRYQITCTLSAQVCCDCTSDDARATIKAGILPLLHMLPWLYPDGTSHLGPLHATWSLPSTRALSSPLGWISSHSSKRREPVLHFRSADVTWVMWARRDLSSCRTQALSLLVPSHECAHHSFVTAITLQGSNTFFLSLSHHLHLTKGGV